MNEEEFAKRDYLYLVENLHLQNKNGFFVCVDFMEDEFTYSEYQNEKFLSTSSKNISQLEKFIKSKQSKNIETIKALLTQCLNIFYIEEKNTFYSSFTSALHNIGNNIFPEDFFENKPITDTLQDKVFEKTIKTISSKFKDFEFSNTRNDFLKIFKNEYVNIKKTISEMPFTKLSLLKKYE